MATPDQSAVNKGLLTEKFYPMLWAFDRLGKHLYAHHWTGNELFALPMDPPEAVNAKRMPLREKIDHLDAEIRELKDEQRRTVDEKRLDSIDGEIKSRLNERNLTMVELYDLPTVDNTYKDAFAVYQRRKETKSQLLNALRKSFIEAQFFGGLVLPLDLWNSAPGYKLYFKECIGVVPANFSSERRGLIVFNRNAFEDWLRGVVPLVIDPTSPPSPQTICEGLLTERVDAGQRKIPKKRHFEEIRNQILNDTQQRLSRRAFDRVWDNVVPNSWKSGGRPRA